MYNYQWPETPAPSMDRRNFPNPAAFLETPSIIGGRPRTQLERPMRIENAPPLEHFNRAYGMMNDSMLFDGNATLPVQTGMHVDYQRHSEPLGNCNLNRTLPMLFNSMDTVKRTSYPITSTQFGHRGTQFPAMNCTLKNYHRSNVQASSINGASYGNCEANNIKRKTPQTTLVAPASKYAKHNVASGNSKAENEHLAGGTATANIAKQDPKVALRILSGTIVHILKLIREQPKPPTMVLLETVANVLSVKAGTRPGERIILLRNHEAGPILQAVYYEIDRPLATALNRGDLVRCVGRLQSFGGRFQILKITRTSEQYERAIVRLQTVSAFASKVMR